MHELLFFIIDNENFVLTGIRPIEMGPEVTQSSRYMPRQAWKNYNLFLEIRPSLPCCCSKNEVH
jgi:hypothetical protein